MKTVDLWPNGLTSATTVTARREPMIVLLPVISQALQKTQCVKFAIEQDS